MARKKGDPHRVELSGYKFGDWLVLNRMHGSVWLCRCSCGTEGFVQTSTLKLGKSKSCGCKGKDWCTTHGLSNKPEYIAWAAMLQRCENPKNKWFHKYGGRGISVCQSWHIFENFYADMGARPKGGTLDRFPNNDGNYEPSNCRWATQAQQVRNRAVTKKLEFNGEVKPLAEWAEIVGLSRKIIKDRLLAGWSVEDALTKPLRENMTHCRKGHEYTPENLSYDKVGAKVCKECSRLKMSAYRERKKQKKN